MTNADYAAVLDRTLTGLIGKARSCATRARRMRRTGLLHRVRSIGATLDAARIPLRNEHDEDDYAVARAFISSGSASLRAIAAELDRAELDIDRRGADVIAWCEQIGLTLYRWQLDYLERALNG